MPEFKDLPDDFRCPYCEGCPYLEGLSTRWVFHRYQEVAGTECEYEHQLQALYGQLDEERKQRRKLELENQQLRAQLQALQCPFGRRAEGRQGRLEGSLRGGKGAQAGSAEALRLAA